MTKNARKVDWRTGKILKAVEGRADTDTIDGAAHAIDEAGGNEHTNGV